jgi:hypothetical protein
METLICRDCGVKKELSEFRKRKRGSEVRTHQCHSCHAAEERIRTRIRRAKKDRAIAIQGMVSLKRAKSTRQVEAICATMIEKFGGINRLCKVWKNLLDEDLKRGGLAGMRHMEAVVRLLQHCDNHPLKNFIS